MKRLNKKGFTLIELLAVIVVLAIILVITVPTVLNTLGSSRNDAFAASANAVAEWFEKQYSLDQAGIEGVSTVYSTWENGKTLTTANELNADLLKAAGLNATDYDAASTVKFTNGRACVVLKATTTGKFKDVTNATSTGVKSSVCD